MSEKENALSFSGIKQMSKTEYYKLFKKPVVWKKATAMVCIAKHKFTNGKIPLVCIPYRKKVEALKAYKEEVKKELSPKFFLITTIQMVKQASGKTVLEITPLKGSANIDTEVATLFQRMKMEVLVKSAPVQETEETSVKEADATPSNTTDSTPNKVEKKGDSEGSNEIALEFKKQVKQLKPEFAKLSQIVTNIKSNKIAAADIESVKNLQDKVDRAFTQYNQLPSDLQKGFTSTHQQLQVAQKNIEKINTKIMFIDSEDESIKQQQRINLESNMQKILARYNIKVNY